MSSKYVLLCTDDSKVPVTASKRKSSNIQRTIWGEGRQGGDSKWGRSKENKVRKEWAHVLQSHHQTIKN